MDAFVTYIQNNGTKVLAFLIGTLGIVANTSDIIPQGQLKYYMLAIALLTYWRGMGNTENIAAAVVQQHADAIAKAAATGEPVVLAPPGKLAPPTKDAP